MTDAWRELYLSTFVEDYLKRHPDKTRRYARRQGRLRLASRRKQLTKTS